MKTYQKLKRQLAEREMDLIELSVNPDSYKSQIIKATWNHLYEIDKIVWRGNDKAENKDHVFKGFLNQANIVVDGQSYPV